MLRWVQLSVWSVFLLALANGVYLYLFPGEADAHYAWPIRPPINAAFMGAGYLSGVLPTALALFAARYWRSAWGLIWPFFVISSVMLLATIIHADKFRWDYPLAWLWLAVYVSVPPLAIVLWGRQQRIAAPAPAPDPRLALVRPFSFALGTVAALVGVALFVAPDTMIPLWPWQITPLLARVFAAWYLEIATTLFFGAVTLRQPHEALIPYAWLAAFQLLLLVLPLRFTTSLNPNDTSLWLWLGLHIALVVLCSGVTLQALLLMRREGQRL
jgi:hypothetical protein